MIIDRSLTDEQLIGRVWDIEDIKKVMCRRSYYVAADDRETEIKELWVSDDAYTATASYGQNTGWYVGLDEIRRWYVDAHRKEREAVLEKWRDAGAEPGGINFGLLNSNVLSTPVIELARDGKTAQGKWFSYSQQTIGKPEGKTEAYWILESVAADLVKQEDGWKIWHIVCANDFDTPVGESFDVLEPVIPPGEERPDKLFGRPTVPFVAHESTYLWEDNYPPIPTPYRSYRDEIGYGPEGHPKRHRHVR